MYSIWVLGDWSRVQDNTTFDPSTIPVKSEEALRSHNNLGYSSILRLFSGVGRTQVQRHSIFSSVLLWYAPLLAFTIHEESREDKISQLTGFDLRRFLVKILLENFAQNSNALSSALFSASATDRCGMRTRRVAYVFGLMSMITGFMKNMYVSIFHMRSFSYQGWRSR